MCPRIVCSLLIALALPAHAQSLPSFFNSNDVERYLPTPNLPVDAYRPDAPAAVIESPPAEQGLFMSTEIAVSGVRIEGGTVYELEALAPVFQPVIGKTVALSELIELTRSITQRYVTDGYPLSYAFMPEQRFTDGVVRVVLVEGYVADYEIEGDVGPVSDKIRAFADKIRGERPLTKRTFARYSSLLNTLPGVTVVAEVPPPGTTDGATRMLLKAQRKTFTSSMNLATSSRDGAQAFFTLSSQARTSLAEQISLSALVPPGEDKESYYRIDYSQLLGSEGLQLAASASRFRARLKDTIQLADGFELSQRRHNERFSLGAKYPLIAAPETWWSLGAQLYGVNDKALYELKGYDFDFDDPNNIRALGVETDWRSATARQMRVLSFGLYQGLNVLGAKTSVADKNFFRLRAYGLQSDRYGENWQGVISLSGFWSDDPLPQSEQAIYGGQNFARGYPTDQASGDTGWGAAYEFNYSLRRDSTWLRLLQPYVVADMARTGFNLPGLRGAKLSSFAAGLRLGDSRYYNVALEAAKPMSDKALDSRNRSVRYTFSFSYQL